MSEEIYSNYHFPKDYNVFARFVLSADPKKPFGETDGEKFENAFGQFLDYLTEAVKDGEKLDFKDFLLLMHGIFYFKGLAYGDSHKKHGELASIFANVSRKYDRLENIMIKKSPEGAETRAETICDLAVYCVLWLEFLVGEDPGMMKDYITKVRSDILGKV